MTKVTRILAAIEQGDPRAAEQLLPLVYNELRRLAAQKLAQEKPGQTLQPTALVHEAYLRLVVHDDSRRWNDRGHFFAAAAQAMRRILVENARRKRAEKAWRSPGAAAARRCRCTGARRGDAGPRRGLAEAGGIGAYQGPARRAAVLRRADGRSGREGPGNLDSDGRPPLGLRQGVAADRGSCPVISGIRTFFGIRDALAIRFALVTMEATASEPGGPR